MSRRRRPRRRRPRPATTRNAQAPTRGTCSDRSSGETLMATRVKLRSGERDWIADVDGETVTLAGDAGTFTLRLDGGWTEVERAGRRWRGAAAQHGDTIWVQLDGEVFALASGRAARRSASGD